MSRTLNKTIRIGTILALTCALLTFAGVLFAAEKQRVVYHVTDVDKIDFTLRNLANHIEGVGGPENVELHLVVIGPAMQGFTQAKVDSKVKESLPTLTAKGVQLEACGNTLSKMNLKLGDLVPGFVELPQGGVVRLAELQMQGFVYIRP